MQELIFLKGLIIILGVSAVVVFALHRIKIPSIIGFLLAGMLLGPYGLGFIKDVKTIQTLAEIGVVLLLFTIGLEFSLSSFLKMRTEVFGIGSLQVVITITLTALLSYQWLGDMNKAVFLGFLFALSSTAIVMKLLSDRAEVHAPHGKISLGILIFQDLCVVPFMLLIPVMSGKGDLLVLALTIVKAFGIVAIVLLSARWIVPDVLYHIVRTKSRELFVITILILCFGTAFITAEIGLSLALGAFIAGLIISDSEYAHEATSIIFPFRDSFNGLFFISVGMLMDISFFVKNILLIFFITVSIIFFKFLSSALSMYVMKRPMRTLLQSSMNLSQVGEFSFVLAVAGLGTGLISNDMYQIFFSASILTMLLTPVIMAVSPRISHKLSSHKILKALDYTEEHPEAGDAPEKMSGHVIIVGYGLNGKYLAMVLKEADIPYVVLELNIDTVRRIRELGEPIFYGDATNIETLQMLGIGNATAIVIAISDPASTRKIVQTARKYSANPELFIIVRSHYASEIDDLLKLGADDVIPENFETSIEIASRVLSYHQKPRDMISHLIDMIREDNYMVMRQAHTPSRKHLLEKYAVISKVEIDTFVINEDSPVFGHTLKELDFRMKTGTTIIAVERDGLMHTNPDPDTNFKIGDTVFITGKKADIDKALGYLSGRR